MLDIDVVTGDLRRAAVDAICTSTNPQLALTIVARGATGSSGGWEIQEECSRIIGEEYVRSGKHQLDVGSAHLTTAGTLPFRGVIHCVASDGSRETSADVIASCVRNALRIADEQKWTSVAMPMFGAGQTRLDDRSCADAMAAAFAAASPQFVKHVVVVTQTRMQSAAMSGALARVD